MCHAQPGAGADHADRAIPAQRPFRTGEIEELVIIGARDGMGDRGKIIDDGVAFHPQLFPQSARGG